MKFTDLLPNMGDALASPVTMFKKREGQPYVQGVARNLGHAAFGDAIGDRVDSRLLGDFNGFRHPQATAPMTPAPMAQVPQLAEQDNTQLLMQWLQSNQ